MKKNYDLAVIGAGIAGTAAALFAADRGLSAVLAGRTGEAFFTGGPADLLGVYPVETGKILENPWEGIRALVKDSPAHPYARVTETDIRTSMAEFYGFLEEGGLAYGWEENANSALITAMGTVKTTHGVPRSMINGVRALRDKASCLIAGIKGLKGFSPNLIAERLKNRWPGLKTATVAYAEGVSEIAPLPLAYDLEISENLARLAEMIRPLVKDVEYVGVPAVIGILDSHQVVESLSREIGRPVFEIPTMPPSIPGFRMREALTQTLGARGVDGAFSEEPATVVRTKDGRFRVNGDPGVKDSGILADAVILASGRFVGGGLTATPSGIRESLFDLPVYQPNGRDDWHRTDFFDPRGNLVNRAGIETDDRLRPTGADGRPVFDNLFTAGTVLAHQDWMRMKCGTGLSVATAFHAVKALAGR